MIQGNSKRVQNSKQDRINDSFNRSEFKVIQKNDVLNVCNIFGGRSVRSMKNVVAADELCKGQFIVQVQSNRNENMLVHALVKIRKQTTLMTLGVAAIVWYNLWTQVV